MMDLPITHANIHDWFPSPTVENPFAGDPWWQVQALGLLCAIQYLRLVPDGAEQQQALVELRRSLDTALLAVQAPDDETIRRRRAQTLAPWCPTPMPVVEAMLDLAKVGADDYLMDLGCGDGRIVFAAVARGAAAIGIDIDARFIAECQERASGLGALAATFTQADLLTQDLRFATVVTCYLLTSSMNVLRDTFRSLKPGTRIVSHAFAMDEWPPTRVVTLDNNTVLYLYIV